MAATLDGLVYVISGRAAGLVAVNEVYDPGTNLWDSRAPILTSRGGIAGAALGGRIFVFGGEGNEDDINGIFPQTEAYDPVTNMWEPLENMPHPRHGISAAVVDNLIYIPGGSPIEGFGVTAVHDVFRPTLLISLDFRRGDTNLDGFVDLSDAILILIHVFLTPEPLICDDAADANDDGKLDGADAAYLLNFLFSRASAPPAPGPTTPGSDPTDDLLGCGEGG